MRTIEQLTKAIHDARDRFEDLHQEHMDTSARFDAEHERFGKNLNRNWSMIAWGTPYGLVCLLAALLSGIHISNAWQFVASWTFSMPVVILIILIVRGMRKSRCILATEEVLFEHMIEVSGKMEKCGDELKAIGEEIKNLL